MYQVCIDCGLKTLIDDQGPSIQAPKSISPEELASKISDIKLPEAPKPEAPKTEVAKTNTGRRTKAPLPTSMLEAIRTHFPVDAGEYSAEEIIDIVRKANPDMENRKEASLKVVIKELCIGSHISKHINRYAFLKQVGEKFTRAIPAVPTA